MRWRSIKHELLLGLSSITKGSELQCVAWGEVDRLVLDNTTHNSSLRALLRDEDDFSPFDLLWLEFFQSNLIQRAFNCEIGYPWGELIQISDSLTRSISSKLRNSYNVQSWPWQADIHTLNWRSSLTLYLSAYIIFVIQFVMLLRKVMPLNAKKINKTSRFRSSGSKTANAGLFELLSMVPRPGSLSRWILLYRDGMNSLLLWSP